MRPCAGNFSRRRPRKSCSFPQVAYYIAILCFLSTVLATVYAETVFAFSSQLSPHSAQTLDLPLALTAPVRFERTPEMAKAKSQSADASAASTTKKRPAAASEIDDIFAKKPKATSTTLASGAATLGTTSTSKPPAKKVKKADKSPAASATAEEKAPAPSIEGYKPAPLEQKTLKEDATEEEKKAFEEEERFRDSRGLREFSPCAQMSTKLTPAAIAPHRSKDGRWAAHL